jgi:hypothetical protein
LLTGPKRHEVTGYWRKSHVEKLRDWYCSPNIIGRRGSSTRTPGHWGDQIRTYDMVRKELHIEFWYGNLKEEDH